MGEHKKTVTEIVLDLESKVNEVLLYVKNIDSNYKLLLNRISNLDKKVGTGGNVTISGGNSTINKPGGKIEINPGPTVVPEPPKVPTKFEDLPKRSKWDEIMESQGVSPDEDPYELIEEVKPTGQRRGQRVAKAESDRVSVSQIVHHFGKPLFLATVEVWGEEGLIKKTRTNTNGRWNAAVPPGNYKIQVDKNSSRSEIENVNDTYFIEVPFKDKVALEVHNVGKKD